MVQAGWGASSGSLTPDWIPWCRARGELLVAASGPVTPELRLSILDVTGEPSVGFPCTDSQ